MFGGLSGGFEGGVGAVKDFLWGRGGPSLDSLPGVSERLAPLKDAQDKLGGLTDSLAGPQDLLAKLQASKKSMHLPTEAIELANASLATFSNTLHDALHGNSKKLLPPGAACAASCILSSIKKKLEAFSHEVADLVKNVKDTPAGISKEFGGVKESLSRHTEGISSSLEQLTAMPDEAKDTITRSMTSLEGLQGLGGALDAMEVKVCALAAACKAPFTAITEMVASTLPKLLTMAKEIIDLISKFMLTAAKKIAKAFKPPAPFCCCSKAGEACHTLQSGLETAAGHLNLEPLAAALKHAQLSLKDLDFGPAGSALDAVVAGFREALAPAKQGAAAAAEAVEKATGSGLKLAAMGEAAPSSPWAAAAAAYGAEDAADEAYPAEEEPKEAPPEVE